VKEVITIQGNEELEGVDTKNASYDCKTVIYSGCSSNLPDVYKNSREHMLKNLKSIKNINSLTIWLGLSKNIFKNKGFTDVD